MALFLWDTAFLFRYSPYKVILGAYFKYYRELDGLSLNYVADCLHINKGYLSELERGLRLIPDAYLDDFFKFYELKFNRDTSYLTNLKEKICKIYNLYIDLYDEDLENLLKTILNQKIIFENSAGFFHFKIIELFYTVHFDFNTDLINHIEKLINKYIYALSDEDSCIFFNIISVYYIKIKKYKDAYKYSQYALHKAEKNSKIYGMILYHLTIIQQYLHHPIKAFILCEEALQVFQKLNIYQRIFYLEMYKGNCFSRMGLYLDAQQQYLNLLSHTFCMHNSSLSCSILNNLSWNSLKFEKFEDSIYYAKKSLLKDSKFEDLYINISYSLYKLNLFEEAIKYINQSLDQLEKEQTRYFLLMIKYRIEKKDLFLVSAKHLINLYNTLNDYDMYYFLMTIVLDYFYEINDQANIIKTQKKLLEFYP